MKPQPFDDENLDALFAGARTLTSLDEAAAERALRSWRQTRARRNGWRWASGLLATAAMLGGVLYLQHGQTLPTHAAYEVYNQASGVGW
ncbi:hypothetical protein [Deinococcus peraridilitoris]|nr:hypothetical protein [Deinococcus peraridilitoris]